MEPANKVEHQLRAELAVLVVALNLERAGTRALVAARALDKHQPAVIRTASGPGLECVDERAERVLVPASCVVDFELPLVEVEDGWRASAGQSGVAITASSGHAEWLDGWIRFSDTPVSKFDA